MQLGVPRVDDGHMNHSTVVKGHSWTHSGFMIAAIIHQSDVWMAGTPTLVKVPPPAGLNGPSPSPHFSKFMSDDELSMLSYSKDKNTKWAVGNATADAVSNDLYWPWF